MKSVLMCKNNEQVKKNALVGRFFYGGRGTRTPKPDGGGFQDR